MLSSWRICASLLLAIVIVPSLPGCGRGNSEPFSAPPSESTVTPPKDADLIGAGGAGAAAPGASAPPLSVPSK